MPPVRIVRKDFDVVGRGVYMTIPRYAAVLCLLGKSSAAESAVSVYIIGTTYHIHAYAFFC
jgi:hypothetical protein